MDKEKILEVLGNIIDINKEQLLKTSVDTKLTDLGLTSLLLMIWARILWIS